MTAPVSLLDGEVRAASVNQTCKKAGATTKGISKGKPISLKCTRVKGKLRWVQVKSASITVSQRNASAKATNYLRSMPFSRLGLIEQLEFEGFSTADATYGVDAQKANWNTQAVKKGESYLRTMAFSKSGLLEQLLFEKFTESEATFGVEGVKADWKSQAAKKAASYLKTMPFSRDGLIEQLVFDGFTQTEAEYAVGTTGL